MNDPSLRNALIGFVIFVLIGAKLFTDSPEMMAKVGFRRAIAKTVSDVKNSVTSPNSPKSAAEMIADHKSKLSLDPGGLPTGEAKEAKNSAAGDGEFTSQMLDDGIYEHAKQKSVDGDKILLVDQKRNTGGDGDETKLKIADAPVPAAPTPVLKRTGLEPAPAPVLTTGTPPPEFTPVAPGGTAEVAEVVSPEPTPPPPQSLTAEEEEKYPHLYLHLVDAVVKIRLRADLSENAALMLKDQMRRACVGKKISATCRVRLKTDETFAKNILNLKRASDDQLAHWGGDGYKLTCAMDEKEKCVAGRAKEYGLDQNTQGQQVEIGQVIAAYSVRTSSLQLQKSRAAALRGEVHFQDARITFPTKGHASELMETRQPANADQ